MKIIMAGFQHSRSTFRKAPTLKRLNQFKSGHSCQAVESHPNLYSIFLRKWEECEAGPKEFICNMHCTVCCHYSDYIFMHSFYVFGMIKNFPHFVINAC